MQTKLSVTIFNTNEFGWHVKKEKPLEQGRSEKNDEASFLKTTWKETKIGPKTEDKHKKKKFFSSSYL